jgi:transcriptional regulator with XRE-family HTH domain
MGTLTRIQVIDLLRKRQGKKSLRRFGDEIGVTAAYLSDVFRGNREPGPTILTLLGVERTKTTETTYATRKP